MRVLDTKQVSRKWELPVFAASSAKTLRHTVQLTAGVRSKMESLRKARVLQLTGVNLRTKNEKHDPRIKSQSVAERDSFVVSTRAKDDSYKVTTYITTLSLHEPNVKTTEKRTAKILKFRQSVTSKPEHKLSMSIPRSVR
eukprot:sb/3474277/